MSDQEGVFKAARLTSATYHLNLGGIDGVIEIKWINSILAEVSSHGRSRLENTGNLVGSLPPLIFFLLPLGRILSNPSTSLKQEL